MKRMFALAALVALLAGCNANIGLQIGNVGKSATVPSVGPGSSFSSSGVSVRFGDAPAAGAFLGAAGLGWLFDSDPRDDTKRTPPLDANRQVNEQDCSQALQNPTANLRCR